jgi:transposase-like protein
VLEGLRGEESIATLCRKEGLAPNLYYRWSKEFLEAGKKRLVGDTTREATSTEVTDLRKENARLKQVVTEKREAIRLVEESDLSARRTLREIQIPRATFYRWYRRYPGGRCRRIAAPRIGRPSLLEPNTHGGPAARR